MAVLDMYNNIVNILDKRGVWGFVFHICFQCCYGNKVCFDFDLDIYCTSFVTALFKQVIDQQYVDTD